MSFEDLKVAELKNVAKTFGVEITKSSKADIIDELQVEGVTYEQYDAFVNADREEVKVQERLDPDDEDTLLVVMERGNSLFGYGKYQFTQTHPFQLMKTQDAERIMNRFTGFRIATPSEAKNYYS